MATKRELVQFTISNFSDCGYNLPLFQQNPASINATTKYSWDITTQVLSCGTGQLVINGITYNLSYEANLTGLLAALNALSFGFFCTETIGGDTYLYVVDDVNVYGDLTLCDSGETTTTTTSTTTAAPTTTSTTSTTTAAPTTTSTTSTTTEAPTTTSTTSTTTEAPTTTSTTSTTTEAPTTTTTTSTTTEAPTTTSTTTTSTTLGTYYLSDSEFNACNQIAGQLLTNVSFTFATTPTYCDFTTLNSNEIPALADGTYYVSDGTNVRAWTKTSTPSNLYNPTACTSCTTYTTTTTTTLPYVSFSLAYSNVSGSQACSDYPTLNTTLYYAVVGSTLTTGTIIYTDTALTSPAINGFYSNGINYWNTGAGAGNLQGQTSCNPTTTTTTTTTTPTP